MSENVDRNNTLEPKVTEPIRSPEEARNMMKEVSWLSKVFSGRHSVKVVALPGDGAWTCGIDHKYAQKIDEYMNGEIDNLDDLPPDALTPNLITIRENDFYRDPAIEIRRKTRHEAAHATHSDFKLLFEGAKKAKDEGFLPSSYMSAANGPEDGWVNAMAAGESQAALDDFRHGYIQKMVEILPQLPQDPLPRQFGVNAINYWLTGKDAPNLDPRVIEITNKVRVSLDKFFSSNSAKVNSEIFNNEIWPEICELEKHEIEDEKQRQMANQPSELGQQAQQEMNQNQQGQGEQSGQPGSDSEYKPGDGSSNGNPIDLSKLSPATIEKLKQAIENLSPEDKQKLEEAARQEVDRRQSEKLNKEAPQIIQMEKNEKTGEFLPKIQTSDPSEVKKAEEKLEQFRQVETERDKQEMAQAQENEAERQRQAEAQKEIQKKVNDMKKEGFSPEEETDYDRYRELEKEIEAEYRQLKQELTRIFPKQLKVTNEGHFFSGRPDPVRAAREYPVGSHKFYERKAISQSQQVNLTIWIGLDISGSMRGQKMDESLKNIIMWSKLTEEFNIPMGIVLFGNSSETIKNSNQPYSDPEQKIKAKLIQKTNKPNQNTNLGSAVEEINTQLKLARRRFPGMQGVALFITDGNPNTGMVEEELKAKIDEIQGTFSTFAFGLGSGEFEQQQMKQMLTSYFNEGSTIVPKEFTQLPHDTTKIMEPIMRRLAQQLRY